MYVEGNSTARGLRGAVRVALAMLAAGALFAPAVGGPALAARPISTAIHGVSTVRPTPTWTPMPTRTPPPAKAPTSGAARILLGTPAAQRNETLSVTHQFSAGQYGQTLTLNYKLTNASSGTVSNQYINVTFLNWQPPTPPQTTTWTNGGVNGPYTMDSAITIPAGQSYSGSWVVPILYLKGWLVVAQLGVGVEGQGPFLHQEFEAIVP
jgi:hypothetical protein